MSVRIKIKRYKAEPYRADIFCYNHIGRFWENVATLYITGVDHDQNNGFLYLISDRKVVAIWAPGEYESVEYYDDEKHDTDNDRQTI